MNLDSEPQLLYIAVKGIPLLSRVFHYLERGMEGIYTLLMMAIKPETAVPTFFSYVTWLD